MKERRRACQDFFAYAETGEQYGDVGGVKTTVGGCYWAAGESTREAHAESERGVGGNGTLVGLSATTAD
jgi:hypothetical protein